jgi:hypothetical protein
MLSTDLNVFLGQWSVDARIPGAPTGHSVFELILDGQYLVQRTHVPVPEAPDSLAVVTAGPEKGAYRQHYYDSRGVTRLYAMTFTGGVWTLLRESADFTPLDFAQRFTGTFSADGDRIDGAWETAMPGEGWHLDFELTYTRLS